MADNRLRDKRINFWLTESEHADIAKRAGEYNMSISEFIRTLALNADIHLDLSKVRTSASRTEERVEITKRLSVDFSDEEFESLSSIAKNKEMTTERYLSSLKFASLPENKMEASFGDVLGKFVDLLDE
jgi:hypothetical protein